MNEETQTAVLTEAIREFERMKRLAERAIAQVDDTGYFARSTDDANSIALLVKHLAGNMWSRWRDFLTTDGEKEDRRRDTEFELYDGDTRAGLAEGWERGWGALLDTLKALEPSDLNRSITIRDEPHSVLEAIFRQMTHYSYHIGQIVLLAREQVGAGWTSLSIPRGKSEEFRQNPSRYLHPEQSNGEGNERSEEE